MLRHGQAHMKNFVIQVKHLSTMSDFKSLYKYDQLHRQRNLGKAFKDFTESQPTFMPTYKYDPGTDEWDSSEKARAPAWCDRILWKGECLFAIDVIKTG